MKRCLNCEEIFNGVIWRCPKCHWCPQGKDNLTILAPNLARQNSGFNPSLFNTLAELEADHFWFRVRNALIIWALHKYRSGITSFMEIGCGTGFVLSGIAHACPELQLTGSEIFTEGLAFAAERISDTVFLQMDARSIPYISEFDGIGAFDVIEHIEEDQLVLQQIYQALKPGGLLLLTVPQYRWLWSSVDEHACHVRRYTASELHDKIVHAGFSILRSTSFVTSLLPLMLLSRLLQRDKQHTDIQAELRILPVLNRLFEWILRIECKVIQAGVSFPCGGSRLIIARRKE